MKTILIFTGYAGYTQRLNNVARMLTEKHGCTLRSLVSGDANYRFLREQDKVDYEVIVGEHELFGELPEAPSDEAEVARIERALGHSLTYIAYADRRLVRHTHSQRSGHQDDQNAVAKRLVDLYRRLSKLVDGVDLVFVYACASVISEILYHLCKSKGIRFLTLTPIRFGNPWGMNVVDNPKDVHTNVLLKYRDPGFKISDEGVRMYETYVRSMRGPDRNPRLSAVMNYRAISKPVTVRSVAGFARRLIQDPAVPDQSLADRVRRVRSAVEFKLRQRHADRNLPRELPNQPYVLFGLHIIPEASVSIQAPEYYDQLSVIKGLSLQVPITWKLLVKEHPGMVGRNTIAFYEELRRIFNVHLLHSGVSTTACIEGAEAIVTLTGTIGMEALALGKKVITLGSSIYKDMDSAFYVGNIKEVGDLLRRPWSDDDRRRQRADLERFASAIVACPIISDHQGVLWTDKAFAPEELPVDREICTAIEAWTQAPTSAAMPGTGQGLVREIAS